MATKEQIKKIDDLLLRKSPEPFPFSGSGAHDDMLDAISHAIHYGTGIYKPKACAKLVVDNA